MSTVIQSWENRRAKDFSQSPPLFSGLLRRSAILALIIGSALTLINQFNALFGSESIQILPLILVYATPFAVIAISQLAGIRQALFDFNGERVIKTREHFVAMAFRHGIPARAIAIGLIMGALNAVVFMTAAYLHTGDIGTPPIDQIILAITLPILFGILSQAIAYRRATKLIAG